MHLRTVRHCLIILGILLLGGEPGVAADPAAAPTKLADCAAIAVDQERLSCFDRLSAAAAEPGAAAPAPITNAVPAPAMATDSLLTAAWGFNPNSDRYSIDLYQPNYLLLGRYSDRPNQGPFDILFDAMNDPDAELDSVESEFQISFKTRVWASDDRQFGVWAAYTQQSQWQVYNDHLSRPFRETNFQPELFLTYNPDITIGDFHWGLVKFGYTHQSNGRSDPISRSWDRLIAEFGVERDNFALLVRPWIVINDGDDDNPNITDYYGHGDITAIYRWRGNSFSLMGRGNIDKEKGAVRLTWTSRPVIGFLRAYLTAFSGYGESMIDYDWRQDTIGAGLTLNDLLD